MSSDELRQLILAAPLFLLAISFHEFAHAWSAVKLGDPTPRYDGRLTLNFFSHISLWGTLMFLIARIGWAKPVRITMRNLKNPKKDMVYISAAGPLANFTLAVLFAFVFKVFTPYLGGGVIGHNIQQMLSIGIWLNVLLGIFNLIPLPPLDGAKILGPFLPVRFRQLLYSMEPWGFLVIYFLFVVAGLDRLLFRMVFWAYRFLV